MSPSSTPHPDDIFVQIKRPRTAGYYADTYDGQLSAIMQYTLGRDWKMVKMIAGNLLILEKRSKPGQPV